MWHDRQTVSASGSRSPVEAGASSAPRGTQALDRAVAILRAFETAESWTPTEIAQLLRLSPSTAQRLMQGLAHHRLLEQDAESRRYRLGMTTAILGRSALGRLQGSSTAKLLERLRDTTGEGVSFGVPGDGVAQVILRVHSRQALRVEPSTFDAAPRHICVLGKLLMAHGALPVDGLTEPFERFTENTIVTYDALHADLALTLARGYAVADEEAMLGVRAIAVPVFGDGEQRPWAAVSVFAPAVRFGPAEMEAAVALAKDAVGGFAP
jgi:IclR family acetate operon transcriptional repressor